MSDYERELTDCLADAGFDGDTVSEAVRLYKTGSKDELKQYLRSKRCDLIESGRPVKCERKHDHDENGRTEADKEMG